MQRALGSEFDKITRSEGLPGDRRILDTVDAIGAMLA